MPNPTQKPRKLWPPWRLPNGTIKASSDEHLEIASESAENWALGSGVVVVAGVAGEIVLALAHMPYDSFRGIFSSLLCDAAIAGGVAVELWFTRKGSRLQGELRNRALGRLEDTEQQLAKALEQIDGAHRGLKWLWDARTDPPDPNAWKRS